MGPDGGEAHDGMTYWCYYSLYPFLCCIRLAQTCISILSFFLHLSFGTRFQVDRSYWFYWKLVVLATRFFFEMSCWFRWLVWIATYYNVYYVTRLLVIPLAMFYSVFGYKEFYNKRSNEPATRRNRRNFGSTLEVFDRRLMLLSAYMLFECMVSFFSLRCLGNSYFWFPFDKNLIYEYMIPLICYILGH